MLAELNGRLVQVDAPTAERAPELGILHQHLIVFLKLSRENAVKFDIPKSLLQKISTVVGWKVERTDISLAKAEAEIYGMLPKEERLEINKAFHERPETTTPQHLNLKMSDTSHDM